MNRKVEKIVVLIIALGSYLLTALSNSIVITGLTKIASDLNLNQILPSWVQNAYGLAFGSFLLLAGRLSDSFSHKSILNIALIIFMLGSFLVGFTTGGGLMIFARFLQGIGSALLAPTSMALLVDNFEGPALVKAIAWYSSTAGLGASLGLILGGIFASYWTWRIGFYLNVPIALVMLVLSLIYLRSKKNAKNQVRYSWHHFLNYWTWQFSLCLEWCQKCLAHSIGLRYFDRYFYFLGKQEQASYYAFIHF